ncbi:MAG: PIN domain-containing protein [Bacteroidota bacterium]
MRKLVLDSCILVHYLTQNTVAEKIEYELQLTASDCVPIISSVTKGELLSFAKQRNWGKNKMETLKMLLSKSIIVDIAAKDEELIAAYSFIDAFSKRKTEDANGKLLNGSAIKMGKNDLWIAATAKVIEAPLITTDKDFLHLNQTVLDVRYYILPNDTINNQM